MATNPSRTLRYSKANYHFTDRLRITSSLGNGITTKTTAYFGNEWRTRKKGDWILLCVECQIDAAHLAIIVNFVVWDEHFAHFKGAFKNVLRILKIAMPDTFYIAMHETFLTNHTIPIDIDEPSK